MDLFFEENEISKIMGSLLVGCCLELGLPAESVPSLLVEFLIVRTQHYRIHVKNLAQAKMHARLLELVARRPDGRVFGQSWPSSAVCETK